MNILVTYSNLFCKLSEILKFFRERKVEKMIILKRSKHVNWLYIYIYNLYIKLP